MRSVLIVGGDSVAIAVCDELTGFENQDVTILWPIADETFVARVARCGARFVRGNPRDEEALERAGVRNVFSIMLLTDDDHLNLETALKARDLSPKVRIVMRQFNRTLGAKIESKLENCSVISIAAHSAATYATVAVDRACSYGVQFPDFTGTLFGFAQRTVEERGLGGLSIDEAEERLGERILAIGDEMVEDRSQKLRGDATVWTFGPVRSEMKTRAESGRAFSERHAISDLLRRLARTIWRTDPLVARIAVAAFVTFVAASIYFSYRLRIDPVAATYYVMSTMTTTGYGDFVPHGDDRQGQLVAMGTMLSGTVYTAILFAVLTSRFTQAQWRLQQGLRKIARRGHVVVCGAGNVGTRVIDFLRALDRQIIVIEAKPRSSIVDRSRDREFDLLTGDATADSTLALCNLEEADALIALTESDTMNLEVALGAGQVNAGLAVILRSQEPTFARSLDSHFGLKRSFSTIGLAAPVLAGLSRAPGVRGFLAIAGRDFGVSEAAAEDFALPEVDGRIPLAVWRDGKAVLISDASGIRTSEKALTLFPAYKFRKSKEAS